MKTTGYPATGFPLPYLADDVDPQAELGQIIAGDDGSEYIYVKAGAADLVVGNLIQAPAETTAVQGLTPAATAAGSTTLTTSSTVTVTANQFAGGYVVVTVTPGLGTKYRIASHPAATAAAVTLTLEEPIQVALTSSSRIDIIANPFNGVIQAPTTLTSAVVGFAVNNITAGNYGWLQTSGVCAVTNDANAAITVGASLMHSPSVAGAVRAATAGNYEVARALTGIASGETGLAIVALR